MGASCAFRRDERCGHAADRLGAKVEPGVRGVESVLARSHVRFGRGTTAHRRRQLARELVAIAERRALHETPTDVAGEGRRVGIR